MAHWSGTKNNRWVGKAERKADRRVSLRQEDRRLETEEDEDDG